MRSQGYADALSQTAPRLGATSEILSLKYLRWYDALIRRARSRPPPDTYFEIHHIVPRSLGGFNDCANLIELTYREHFLAHWLLTKIHSGRSRYLMVTAFGAMAMLRDGRNIASWQYHLAKKVLKDQAIQRAWDRHQAKKAKRIARERQIDSDIRNQLGDLTVKRDHEEVGHLANEWMAAHYYAPAKFKQKRKPITGKTGYNPADFRKRTQKEREKEANAAIVRFRGRWR